MNLKKAIEKWHLTKEVNKKETQGGGNAPLSFPYSRMEMEAEPELAMQLLREKIKALKGQ